METTNQFFTGNEYNLSFCIFLTNTNLAKEFNSKNEKITVSLNLFATYTQSEYKSLFGLHPTLFHTDSKATKIKANADHIGDISAISAIEAHYTLYQSRVTEYSELQLIYWPTGIMTSAFCYVIASLKPMLYPKNEYGCTDVNGDCKDAAIILGYYNGLEGD